MDEIGNEVMALNSVVEKSKLKEYFQLVPRYLEETECPDLS